jgi:hypothetical protein
MRKSIVLTVVAVTALAIAGFGGVFADYQDIETSEDNYVETGSLDLKVSYRDVLYDDPNVPILVTLDNVMPECQDKSFHFDLHNAGVYEQGTGWVYFHVKNLVCTDTGRTEPEDAVELGTNPIGEKTDGTFVYSPGLGTNSCMLIDHLRFDVYTSPTGTGNWTQVDLSAYDLNGDYDLKMNEIVCNQVLICELDSQETIYAKIDLWFQDIPEEDLGYDLFDENTDEVKFNDWPTNALQDDQVEFDISFELFQFPMAS